METMSFEQQLILSQEDLKKKTNGNRMWLIIMWNMF